MQTAFLAAGPDDLPPALLGAHPGPRSFRALKLKLRTPFSSNIASEARWLVHVVRTYAEDLANFVQLQDGFEHLILVGNYAEAADTLRTIIARHGLSLWAIDARLRISDCVGGLQSNRSALAEMRTEGLAGEMLFFASVMGKRIESDLSAAHFLQEATRAAERATRTAQDRDWVLYRSALPLAPSRLEALAYCLWAETATPVIDQYLALVRSLQLAVSTADGAQRLRYIGRELLPYRRVDRRIALLCARLVPDSEPIRDLIVPMHQEAGHLFLTGEYQRATEASAELLVSSPDELDAYLIHIKSQLYRGRRAQNVFPHRTLGNRVYGAISDILDRGAQFQNAVARASKLALMMENCRLGVQLLAFCYRESRPQHALASSALLHLNDSSLTAAFAESFPDGAARSTFLDSLVGNVEGWILRLYWSDRPHHSSPESGPLAAHRALHAARRLEQKGQPLEAADLYRRALRYHRPARPVGVSAKTGLFRALLACADYASASMLAADLRLRDPHVLSSLPVQDLYAQLRKDRSILRGSSARPIIAHYCQLEHSLGARETQEVHSELDRFLRHIGATRPSELLTLCDTVEARQELIHLYNHVCSYEVLEFSRHYANSDELDAERIKLCQSLMELDVANAEEHSREISRRTQAAAIRRAIREVDASKIFVDRAGLVRKLNEKLPEQFVRFRAYSSLDERLREDFTLQGVSPEKATQVVVISDLGYRLFCSMFADITTSFLSSDEHGLDSYLSVRIRHGTLAGQIRGATDLERIVTRKDAKGHYLSNDYWIDRLASEMSNADIMAIDTALRAFSRRVDDTIEWMTAMVARIRSEQHPDGLFDYAFSDEETTRLFTEALFITEYNAFVSWSLNKLWERTERNLARIVTEIRTTVQTRFEAHIRELQDAIAVTAASGAHSDLEGAIARTSTQVVNALQVIAAWFSVPDERRAPPFSLELLTDTALQIVRRCYPHSEIAITRRIDASARVSGEFFASFVDVMFILLENIVKHSGLGQCEASITAHLRDGELSIDLTNALAMNCGLPALSSAIERINQFDAPASRERTLPGVRSEGGSGYSKLHKILRHDLKRGDAYSISARTDDGRFGVRLTMRSDNLEEAS